LVHLVRKGEVEKICFLLAQCIAEFCPIPKSLGNITKLSANIQKKWLESCLEELKSFKDKNVYKVVDLPKGRKVIKNFWVFKITSDSYYRSQIVAKEFSQVKEVDFDKLFFPFVHYEIACLFPAVAVLEDWDIHSIDVKTAYLYSNLDKEIYIE